MTVRGTGPIAPSPIFDRFLDRVTAGDAELKAYLQRMLGYGLTGWTKEHALFFLHGSGANGKSVLLSTIAGILGDYHRTAPIETFTAERATAIRLTMRCCRRAPGHGHRDRGGTALGGIAHQDSDRRRPISARYMRQDFFGYLPQFKLVVAGNHRPGLRLGRRGDPAPLPPRALRRHDSRRRGTSSSASGCARSGRQSFTWLIDGCLRYQQKGLAPPDTVRNATAAYLDAEDAIAAWMEECCAVRTRSWTASSSFFRRGRGGLSATTSSQVRRSGSPRLWRPGRLPEAVHGGRGIYGPSSGPYREPAVVWSKSRDACDGKKGKPLLPAHSRARARASWLIRSAVTCVTP